MLVVAITFHPFNYSEFMKIYDPLKNNAVEAAMATPAAKAMGPGWEPINIQIKPGVSVKMDWIKK